MFAARSGWSGKVLGPMWGCWAERLHREALPTPYCIILDVPGSLFGCTPMIESSTMNTCCCYYCVVDLRRGTNDTTTVTVFWRGGFLVVPTRRLVDGAKSGRSRSDHVPPPLLSRHYLFLSKRRPWRPDFFKKKKERRWSCRRTQR